MKSLCAPLALVVLLASSRLLPAQETPQMPEPTAQHKWLQQLTGKWDTTITIHMPGEEAVTNQGVAVTRPIGGFWVLSELSGEMMGSPFLGVQTLGFDAEKQEFVGTWVDSMSGYQWLYRGQLDESRKKLTLLTEGPCPMRPGELSEFKEVLEVKDKDHLTFTSSVKDEQGEWGVGVEIEYRRKE